MLEVIKNSDINIGYIDTDNPYAPKCKCNIGKEMEVGKIERLYYTKELVEYDERLGNTANNIFNWYVEGKCEVCGKTYRKKHQIHIEE